jgi:hypothetical protein
MNRTHTQAANPLARYPGPAQHDAIEWEELPSLAPRMVPMDLRPAASVRPIVMRTQATDFNTAWGVTMPAPLDTVAQPAMFEEAISGLVTREVDEPELFKHFFG